MLEMVERSDFEAGLSQFYPYVPSVINKTRQIVSSVHAEAHISSV